MKFPTTLLEAVQYFSDPKVCVEFVKNLFWKDGMACRYCGDMNVKELSTRQLWQCNGCRKQFSVRIGTIFEDSPLSLSKWLIALWLIVNAKNGISSYEIHRAIGVTQKTAWFMLHRIRHAMKEGFATKLSGVVEADETYIGGIVKNKHVRERLKSRQGEKRSKTIVMGMLERGGRVVAHVIPDTNGNRLHAEVKANVQEGSTLYTDDLNAYKSLKGIYKHDSVNHVWEYVRGKVHTNSIEGFWALLKRCIKGTYIHMKPFYLNRYLDEECCRYNWRKLSDAQRFERLASQIFDRRLSLKDLKATP